MVDYVYMKICNEIIMTLLVVLEIHWMLCYVQLDIINSTDQLGKSPSGPQAESATPSEAMKAMLFFQNFLLLQLGGQRSKNIFLWYDFIK
jgi:hypothetical protein